MGRSHVHRSRGQNFPGFPTARDEINKSQTPVSPAGLLTTQLIRILRNNVDLAMPALQLLDLYFCLWDCYIVKSAEKIYLDEEQQQIQESNEWLETENDALVQRCNAQKLMLWGRERVLHDLHAGVAAVLKASGERAYRVERPQKRSRAA